MIICPKCKQEIDDDSRYCDQCGQALLFCSRCGRVGLGQRCTYCGSEMISAKERDERRMRRNTTTSVASDFMPRAEDIMAAHTTVQGGGQPAQPQIPGLPQLTLYNPALNLRLQGVPGAVIGRRQGIYKNYFAQDQYVSGLHAQLLYNVNTGWSVVDKHSSNGTKLNRQPLQPDVPAQLHNGDILTIANVNLQVSISK